MSTPYVPRTGSKADQAIAYLARMPAHSVTTQALADAIGASADSISANLGAALRHGLLSRRRSRNEAGHTVVVWALGPGEEAEQSPEATADDEPPPPFICSLWSDGDLSLRVNGDDLVLAKADADALRRYLAQFPAPPAAAEVREP